MNRPATALLLLLAACSPKPPPLSPSPISHPPSPSSAPAGGATEGKPSFPPLALRFDPPAAWIREEPANRLRKAQYRVPPKTAGSPDALLTISHFSSASVSTEANIARWAGQVEGSIAKPETVAAALKTTFVDLRGTYRADGEESAIEDAAMLAAVVETPSGPWYLKLAGPAATVAPWRDEFVAALGKVTLAR